MADQAVDIGCITEIKVFIYIAITNMALGATTLIGGYGDTEIVDIVFFTVGFVFNINDIFRNPLSCDIRDMNQSLHRDVW
jgi:hypothetical protein